ncbi:HEAT repeat domain-containing protein [Streptomyces sp. NPDC102274]|uniref:HEAT repeat domain-containing protein n=1 Tax=Streptomyces sp. NPDC102274 TaxID=3366151 RepID=UPI0038087C83
METGTAAELVERALTAARAAVGTDDSDEYGTLLWQAAADGAASLPLGLELIGSQDPTVRETGCDLLGHASDQNEAVRAETATALVALAEQETESRVLRSLAQAIERTYDQRAVPVLVALAGHPDAEVRRRVAGSFAGVVTGPPDGPDIHALITLTRDEDPRVRTWATFTLGFQAEVDSPAIRTALWERTTDENPDTREEGIRGLARRHDPRVVPLLAELLDDPDGAHVLTFSAARIMGVPELLPALLEYEPDGAGVTAAVNACDPVRRAQLDASAWELVSTLHRLRPDLDAAVHMERFDGGLSLGLGATFGSSGYDVEALLARADGSPVRAAGLVATDLPRTGFERHARRPPHTGQET